MAITTEAPILAIPFISKRVIRLYMIIINYLADSSH